jgi:processive 1,2-diacylglycerol beta-glucosyltransferase
VKISNVVCYSFALSGEHSLAYLRLIGPLRLLGINIINGIENNQININRVSEGDIIIIQRDFPKRFDVYNEIIKIAHKEGKPVVFELDDLLFYLPESHPDRQNSEGGDSLLPMFQALMEADLVCVPTTKLRDFGVKYNNNVAVLPNYFDDSLWHFKPPALKTSENDTLIIGYMGGNSHKPDLEYITPVLQDIIKQYPQKICLHFFGAKPPDELTYLTQVKWIPANFYSYKEFSAFFQDQMVDIFIAPLIDNPFNKHKSPIKFFEYSALGVPGVFSNLETYSGVITHGHNGLLASSLNEWTDCLLQLIEDENLRFFIATNAQETIRSNWLLSKNAFRWEEILQNMFDVSLLTKEQNNHVMNNSYIVNIVKSINLQLFETFNKKDAEVQSLTSQVVEREQSIQMLSAQIDEHERVLQEIYDSRAWRFVQLLRSVRSRLM